MDARPYHHGHLEAALVDAGEAAARDGGAGAVTLRELAKSVGVSPAAAYRHFPSLDHLVAAVSQRARERLAARMIAARDALPDDGGPEAGWARFLATGRAYVAFGTSEPRLFETAFAPCPAPPRRADDPAAWDVLVGALDALEARGAITDERRTDAPLIAWSAVHGLASIIATGVLPEGSTPDAATDAVLLGVRRALEG
jgi:AcrR family transcriptional regulator